MRDLCHLAHLLIGANTFALKNTLKKKFSCIAVLTLSMCTFYDIYHLCSDSLSFLWIFGTPHLKLGFLCYLARGAALVRTYQIKTCGSKFHMTKVDRQGQAAPLLNKKGAVEYSAVTAVQFVSV